MIGVVTDSSAQLLPRWADRPDVEVVPIHVSVDGKDHRDGVDIDPAWFHARIADGAKVSTSQPSPGEFARAFRSLEQSGCDRVIAVHVGAAMSGTTNAARLAAELVDVPVDVVDTGLASFGVSCCVIEALRLIDAGQVDRLADAVSRFARGVRATFIIQATDFVRAAGRSPVALPEGHDGVAVFGGVGADIGIVATEHDVDSIASAMVAHLAPAGARHVVAVGVGDPSTRPFADAMFALLADRASAIDVLRYEVTPSVMAYSGLGAAGGYSFEV